MEELGEEQDPPFSHGNYYVEIRNKFITLGWVNYAIYKDSCEAMFAILCRQDFVFADSNFATFSTRRINDTFRTFSENLAARWPGYELKGNFIVPVSDHHLVHMDDLLRLLRSKDIDRY